MRLAITWPVALMLPSVLTYARVGHRQEILSVSEYFQQYGDRGMARIGTSQYNYSSLPAFDLEISSITGASVIEGVRASQTLGALKAEVASQFGTDAESMLLVSGSRPLENHDSELLGSCGVKDGSKKLHMAARAAAVSLLPT